ncbi:MAG: TIM-barrel domain-containing protein [Promethearchaeia archaeon]
MITYKNDGISLEINDSFLRVRMINEKIIQIQYNIEKNSEFIDQQRESLSVLDKKREDVDFGIIEREEKCNLKTNQLIVKVDKENGIIEFLKPSGSSILKEGTRKIERAVVMDEKTHHIQQNFKWEEEEALYGLGQHQDVNNKLNYRNLDLDLYQGNIKVSVPILISSKGYGILWDNYSYTKFRDSVDNSHIWSEVGDQINYYFIFGPEIDDIIKHIRYLTGKSPMFPKWVFGDVQSKERYKTAEELVGIVEEYRRRKIPLDIIVQDWKYWGSALKWGYKSFSNYRYPNPTQIIEKIHQLNAKVMISIWPIMSIITSDYWEMRRNGFLYKSGLKPLGIYDAFNPEARDLYWKQAEEGLFKHGIDAWWCDSTEPMFVETKKARPKEKSYDKNSVKTLKKVMRTPAVGTAARYLNAYSLMHSKGIYKNQRASTSKKRVVNLTRSGFIGQQRFATITWSGDVPATWNFLAAQIPAGLNFCMTGLPYWTSDIGAFDVTSMHFVHLEGEIFPGGNKNLGYREFYTRWFQFGAFLPMFRSHGTDTDREVWRFGEPGTKFYDTIVKFINLRYRLLSYNYSVAWMITSQDYTMMRSLIFDFRRDPKVLDINDEYMFGPSFLVCPVLKPMYYNKHSEPIFDVERKRSVYLPEGNKWYDFWTGKQYEGGKVIETEAPIEIIPLFIRAGSIIPLNSEMQYSTEKPADPLEIRIYRGKNCSFLLYEDEYDNYNYEQGLFSTIKFSWNDDENRLKIEARKGEFPGMLKNRVFRILFVAEGKGVSLEKSIKFDDIIKYEGKAIEKSYNSSL